MIEEYGGGSFVVHYGRFYEEYTKHHIRYIVKERFGPKCHRVFSIVLAQKMIEQKQVGAVMTKYIIIPINRNDEVIKTGYWVSL